MATDNRSGLKTDDAPSQADQAMTVFNQAIAAGFPDPDKVRKNSNFDALRNRDDFKKLLERVTSSRPGG
jgi:hypothetical protein